MVNELNKPPADNAALSERLAASNRQLHEMQEEHRQLLLEMETLRARAAELTRLNAQRQQLRQPSREEPASQVEPPAESPAEPEAIATEATEEASPSTEELPTEAANPNNPSESATAVEEKDKDDDSQEDKEESASYLQEKLNEIANLKAQFKRVQHMVDTTKLIEEHMATKETHSVTMKQSSSTTTAAQTMTTSSRVAATEEATSTSAPTSTPTPMLDAAADNAELLNSMLNMFTDFTSDLRGQAEGLRAERERIKTLKEDIMRRKQGK